MKHFIILISILFLVDDNATLNRKWINHYGSIINMRAVNSICGTYEPVVGPDASEKYNITGMYNNDSFYTPLSFSTSLINGNGDTKAA